jgi:hypothetical protein
MPGHAVNPQGPQHFGISRCHCDAFFKLVFAPRQAGEAALSSVPVAGRQVEQHLLKAEFAQPRINQFNRPVIGKQIFDRLEPTRSCSPEPVRKNRVL